MVDVLLINPGDQSAVYQQLAAAGLVAKEPPIWCRLIASYLRAVSDLTVEILDAEAYDFSPGQTAAVANNLEPVLAVVVVHGHQPSASTQKMPAAKDTVGALKLLRPEMPVLLVGAHPAALPLQTLKETDADFVCTGEGPLTTLDLVTNIKTNRFFGSARGLAWLEDDVVVYSRPAPNVDLNLMPGGCWEMLPMARYRSYTHHAWSNNFRRQPYASIYTSVNCPFQCAFCMISTPFRRGDELRAKRSGVNYYRTWSVDAVMNEIDCLVERYGVTNIRFDDEMFVLNLDHVKTLCDNIAERYGDKLNLWCYGRVDQTTEPFLDVMARAGFKWLALGIESMSSVVRDGVGKAQYDASDIAMTVKLIQSYGINIIANYIFGLPDDTVESMEETLRLALQLKTEYVNMYSAVAFPGSKLWEQRLAAGWKPPRNWLAWSFHSYEHEPLGNDVLSPKDVLQFRDAAFKRYFSDVSYRDYVEKRFGAQAITEINYMLSYDLKRRLLSD